MSLDDIDIYDPLVYERGGIPHDDLKRLRHEDPVHWHPEPNGPGFWAIMKHEDIITCSTQPKLFSTWLGGTNIEDYPEDDLVSMRAMMANMDPPQHSKYRRIVSRAFRPKMIATLEAHLRTMAGQIIDRVADKGECDFVRDLAVEFPLQTIAEFLGVPHEDRLKIFDWSNTLIAWDDPEYQGGTDPRLAAMQLWQYANELAESRRERKTEDLTTMLLDGDVDGESLTELEFDAFFLLIAVAGNETTRNALTAGLYTLFQHPDQLDRLRGDLSLLPTAIEEMLRWICPVNYFRRTASEDTELRGRTIAKGQKIAMFYSSANRDEDVFADPYTFDIARDPNEHLSFGVGEHFCLGANLARLEIRIFFEELFARMPDVELGGDIRRLRSNFINGIKEMPIRFTPTRRRATA